MDKIPIGISSCLLGERVRFDGGHKNSPYISQTLAHYFEFKSFCPEMSIGLGVPRETIRLVRDASDANLIHCKGTKNPDLDVTEALTQCASQQCDWIKHLSGYLVKKGSPSCGMERVKVYHPNGMPESSGSGLYTRTMMEQFPHLPIEEEGRLGDAVLRENFIKRVFIYHRWRQMTENPHEPVTPNAIIEFHSRHKLIFMSHDQHMTKALGRLVSQIGDMPIETLCHDYLAQMTAIVRKPATRKNHVNVLQHIQGYLKRDLDSDDKQELNEVIEHYRLERLPLIVPITLLKHHFRKAPNQYIDDSYYLQPHPFELMLLNGL